MIDTNVVSILAIRGHSPRRDFYYSRLADKRLIVSFFTVHEVLWGIADADLGATRKAEILSDLGKYEIDFASNELIAASVQLRIAFRHEQLSLQDLFIASSAVALRCPFATDDRPLAEALESVGATDIISRHLQATN